MKLVKVKHPVFKDVVLEIEPDRLDEHLGAGWLEMSQRRKATVKATAEPEAPSPATDEQ